ncbi:uncharacterized protein JCM15063_003901 [Sporobolomyces koalae]|uniref:uncharacterized protein n=1 Tax=Sporobolomyces koalae TaxID=500713 RepID=UPI00317FBA77
MTTTELLDHLDRLLGEYLSLLDQYQAYHASLERDLKQGYFHLAKSKLALGPTRVSQPSWDLSAKDSQVQVVIRSSSQSQRTGEEETSTTTTTGKHDRDLNLNETPLLWSLERRVPNPTNLDDSSHSTLRHRARGHRSGSKSAGSSARPAAASPLNQFSAFPPPALRAAASSFESTIGQVVRVVELERQLHAKGHEIERIKDRIERERGKAGQVGLEDQSGEA